MRTSNFLMLLGVAGLGGYVLFKKYAGLFNPLSQNNLANQAVDSAYANLTGSAGTPGTDLYNVLHPYNPNAAANYFVYGPNGDLQRDATGNLLLSAYPPGTPAFTTTSGLGVSLNPGNPYPNPTA